jgi:hypothetical protein
MKSKILASISVLLMHASPMAMAQISERPQLVPAPAERSYVPQGFDTNDNAQVVVAGEYPNSCFRVGHSTYSIDRLNKKIDIEVTAYKSEGYCLQVMVPFHQEVSLGLLEKGEWSITINQDPANSRVMHVREAVTASRDDHVYAPVSEVIRTGPREFLLRGNFQSPCLSVAEIKLNYEEGEVISVLPMAAYDSTCLETNQSHLWEAKFQVKNELEGDYLLHIRSLNGDALNSVQSFTSIDL